MLKAGGYAVLTSPTGMVQWDTFTCGHDSVIVHVPPYCDPANLGGFCKICSHLICGNCYNAMQRGEGCVPWEKRMDKMEARDRFLRSAGLTE